MNRAALRDRYMRDALPVRLGGLAANLARVESFSTHPDHGDAVARLLEESKFFIEWTAPGLTLERQVELLALQRAIAQWQRDWAQTWADPERRAAAAGRAGGWSRRVLAMSGLVVTSAGE